ncbi:serine palmitoyltransferase 1-like [Sarcoptes scabiei]|nr:serine palmitoyltransferase 1-like [Sarcoptes scabiei]
MAFETIWDGRYRDEKKNQNTKEYENFDCYSSLKLQSKEKLKSLDDEISDGLKTTTKNEEDTVAQKFIRHFMQIQNEINETKLSQSIRSSINSNENLDDYVVNVVDSSLTLQENPMPPPLLNRNYQEARYKTELCLHFRERNFCPHGTRCLFAHGLEELRPYRGRHPKHKTQHCKAFHEQGFCNYGYRCSYIHSESPRTIEYIKRLNRRAQIVRRNRFNKQIRMNNQNCNRYLMTQWNEESFSNI